MSGTALRRLLDGPAIAKIPGAGSPLDVLLIEQAGFGAAYISGYAVSAQRYGLPDTGIVAFKEMRDMVQAVRDVTQIPIIVDCDTGYGGVLNIRQTVRAFEEAGASALQIEDQTTPKRCGHMVGKAVETMDVSRRRIEAALKARRDESLMIIARTDARVPLGFDEAMRRCQTFMADGADMAMMHGAKSLDELKSFAAEIGGPKLISFGEGECSDTITPEQAYVFGYRGAVFPSSPLRLSIFAMRRLLGQIRDHGEVRSLFGEMVPLEEANEVVGLSRLADFETGLR